MGSGPWSVVADVQGDRAVSVPAERLAAASAPFVDPAAVHIIFCNLATKPKQIRYLAAVGQQAYKGANFAYIFDGALARTLLDRVHRLCIIAQSQEL